jgi:hypothetical protein
VLLRRLPLVTNNNNHKPVGQSNSNEEISTNEAAALLRKLLLRSKIPTLFSINDSMDIVSMKKLLAYKGVKFNVKAGPFCRKFCRCKLIMVVLQIQKSQCGIMLLESLNKGLYNADIVMMGYNLDDFSFGRAVAVSSSQASMNTILSQEILVEHMQIGKVHPPAATSAMVNVRQPTGLSRLQPTQVNTFAVSTTDSTVAAPPTGTADLVEVPIDQDVSSWIRISDGMSTMLRSIEYFHYVGILTQIEARCWSMKITALGLRSL